MQYEDLYFNWLYDKVKGIYYDELLWFLYTRPYKVTKDDMDHSRMIDCNGLRRDFEKSHAAIGELVDPDSPYSFLEMLIAMAIRCDDSIMYEERYGDRSIDWFWCFIDNLGLSRATNSRWNRHWQNYAEECCQRILNRDYKRNGEGGLFVINDHPDVDIRKIPLWTQLNWWIHENLTNGNIK